MSKYLPALAIATVSLLAVGAPLARYAGAATEVARAPSAPSVTSQQALPAVVPAVELPQDSIPSSAPPPPPVDYPVIVGSLQAKHVVTPRLPVDDGSRVRIEGTAPGLGVYDGPVAHAPAAPTPVKAKHRRVLVREVLAVWPDLARSPAVRELAGTRAFEAAAAAPIMLAERGPYLPGLTQAQKSCAKPPTPAPSDKLVAITEHPAVLLPVSFSGTESLVEFIAVYVDRPGEDVVLLLAGPSSETAWRVQASPGTRIKQVWASGYGLQAVLGVDPSKVAYSVGMRGCPYVSNASRFPHFVQEHLGVASARVELQRKTPWVPYADPAVPLPKPHLMNFVDDKAPAVSSFALALLEREGYVSFDLALKGRAKDLDAMGELRRTSAAVLLKPFAWPPGLGGANSVVLFVKPKQERPSGHPWHSRVVEYD